VTRAARSSLARAALGLALTLAAAPARADTPADAQAQASNYFDAGAQAYEAGQYLVAAEAFLKAHEVLPSPSLLFSAAQAYRRHYLTEPSPDALRRAVALYRDYLRADPRAKRREEAIEALGALAPLEARLSDPQAAGGGEGEGEAMVRLNDGPGGAGGAGAPGQGGGAPSAGGAAASSTSASVSASAPGRSTRLLLTAHPDSAQVSLDDGPFLPTPVVAEVQTGAHRVRVRAQGYHDEQTTVSAVANELTPRHVLLRPKAARLRVKGTSGARVAIDGQVRATVPTAAPIAIEPGAHVVTVTLSGHEPYSQRIDLRRDESAELDVDLPRTPRRIAAWGVLSAGAAGAVASGVLAGLALARQGEAVELREQRESGVLLPADRDRYNEAVAARNDFQVAAAVTGGAAALTMVIGVGLYLFDDPEVPPQGDELPASPPAPKPRTELTVGVRSLGLRVTF